MMPFSPLHKITSFTRCVLLLLSAGCTTAHYWPIRLDSLEDGKTPRKTVIAELGQPSGTYEGERLISYRLGKKSGQYFILDKKTQGDMNKGRVVSWLSGFEGEFLLVLEFDEHHVLQKHSMTKVQ